MNRTQAENLVAQHARPIFGFSLKRCARIQDAEDVAQEIVLRAFRALLTREDIADPVRYIWTVAHHVLANHYRERSRFVYGTSDPGMEDNDPASLLIEQEAICHLRQEIAHLGRTQREIVVAYYFHGRRQTDIASAMKLPLGTVKWHLFEAKKELKKNMEHTRSMNHLMFDPIRFTAFGIEGSIGEEGSPWRFFRSALNQNIAYATWPSARTVAEIAQALGVSPVYVEDAVDYMMEQGYLTLADGRYRCNLLLTEATAALNDLSTRMYQDAARLIAPALIQALIESDFWTDEGFYPGAKPTEGRMRTDANRSFILWALIPWCIANSQHHKAIRFDEVATLRPDGARNIIHATIAAPGASLPALYEQMDDGFSGPCWNEHDGVTLWQVDTCWSDKRISEIYQLEAQMTLALLRRLLNGDTLSLEEYAQLAQKELLRINGDPDQRFSATILPVWLQGKAIREKLLGIVQQVYDAHSAALTELHAPYADALLAQTPAHLQKLRRYMLQNLFQSDWFIMHCLHTLVEMKLLAPPTDDERSALHTIILTK